MLSAAVRRSSRDVNVMKEKLIFSGKPTVDRTPSDVPFKRFYWLHVTQHEYLRESTTVCFLLHFLFPLLKVSPSSRVPPASFVCDVHHLLSILPLICPPAASMPLTHYIHCTHCIFYCVPCDPCIISSRTSPTFVLLKMSPSVGESKHTSMTRPLVLGVKGKSHGNSSSVSQTVILSLFQIHIRILFRHIPTNNAMKSDNKHPPDVWRVKCTGSFTSVWDFRCTRDHLYLPRSSL